MFKFETIDKLYISLIFFLMTLSTLTNIGFCLDSKGIEKLRKAGITGETIQVIIREKVIETCAFNIDELVALKRSGFSDETMQKIIMDASFMKNAKPIAYGKNIKSLKMTTINDIIELKQSGVSEETIKAIITYKSESSSDKDREEAWEMLKSMGIIIDRRGKH